MSPSDRAIQAGFGQEIARIYVFFLNYLNPSKRF